MRLLALLAFGAVLVVLPALGDPPRPAKGRFSAVEGKWRVEFANGVVEECEVGEGGKASVVEPRRSAAGQVEAKAGSYVILFADDRVERWTPVGRRFVVEHWFPASQVPVATPVLGIAERGQ